MRVVIAKKLVSAIGGSELQARLLARALRERGHDVRIVGMRTPWARPGLEGRNGDGIALVRSRGGLVGSALDALLPVDLADRGALRDALRGAEVVHSIAREWAGTLARVARDAAAAFVETPLVHPGQPFSGDAPREVVRYREDDAVLALTEWEAAWYRDHGVARVHVTGVGPAVEEPTPSPPDPATILFVGRKERYKGYHALRDAAPLVWRERPDATFVAIGQRAWHDRFARPPRDRRWVELGVVDEATKASAYARATVLVMPSEHETFGHTYLEAWAYGRPVIAGDIPPLREIVRAGIDGLHARNEPRASADAILRILAEPDAARRMGESGRARLGERWTWPIVAERTERAYLAALDRVGGPTEVRL